ncbi:unnamed protein product [Miscanthus lutarioriparius]|uniref:Uncharacterized protein n=1 Tax=Miscanthus lutarioriparius TaxID=422564 RepID=A0A811QFS5_9POAL|nr:unnamed protein product [Miscanthus lutarioriparius]
MPSWTCKRSRLIRRWSAEGYVKHDHSRSTLVVAEDNFKKLVDQSTIWPIDTSKNANVKTCRAHSIFHEFLLYMSMSSKFITSFNNEERKDYRHLFIQNTPNSKYGDDEEKSRAHSLTIYGSAGEAAGYFAKYQLLRVLDLEECKDLEDKHLDGIHKLWYLKYLSVGDKISRLPKHIEKLHCLETLDMRKTKKVIILPVEVIKLPHLAHLLGRFKLDKRDWDKSEPQKYVPEKSNLQTLAGFVTDNNSGFSKLMLYMKILKKVKICCNSTTDEGLDGLLVAIENFVQADLDTGVCVRSLSLDIGNFSVRILRSLAYASPRLKKELCPISLSLRLLNHGLDGLSGIEIKWHKILQEIALDSEVKQETKTDWEDSAKKHPKRPRVLYLKSVDLNGTGSMKNRHALFSALADPRLGWQGKRVGRQRQCVADRRAWSVEVNVSAVEWRAGMSTRRRQEVEIEGNGRHRWLWRICDGDAPGWW